MSDRGIKTWIMSVMEMVTFKVLEIVTVKALEKVTVKARIRMVRYCFNDAVWVRYWWSWVMLTGDG